MLQLYGLTKNKLQGLKQYKDYCIESELSTGDKTLSFLYPLNLSKEIKEEGYIRNKTDEFVIKEVSTQGNWKSIKAKLNVEDLEGKVFELFDSTNEIITDCINLALAGTGWIVGTCDVTRRRTVRKTNSSSWDIIQEARKVYRCELEFDTLNKKVNIYEKRGIDKGVYFLDSLNLKDLSIQSDSYDFYTRIIAKGKDNLKVTLENFQYSNKIKTYIWKDERYTNIESLTEDAEAKLDELSKPYRAYSATIIDLANISKEDYKDILSYNLGDVITLVSKENEIKEKQRIVKMVEYPDEPDRNTCEIANTTLSFEDVQKEFQDTSDTVNNITTDNGTVDGSKINGISTEQIYDFEASVGKITDLTIVNARIDELYANKANISELNVVIANVAELNATKANITDLNTINANIQNLIAADATINNALIGKADITELNAVKGTIISLDSKIANIETLVNGNLSSENIQAGGITSDKLTIANGFITNAMIASLDVAKINAGDISTNKFRIVSDNGGIEIVGATQQFKDKNNKVRIQMGQDATGNFNFILRGEDGTTTLIDHTGIKEKAIADNLIKENMVAADAIGEKQINYSSLITGLNKDTNTQLIKASKVAIDLTGQSLEVAFNSLKSNVDNIQVGGRNLWILRDLVSGYEDKGNIISSTSQHKIMNTLTELNGATKVSWQIWNTPKINNTSNTNRIAFYNSSKVWISSVNIDKLNGTTCQKGIITVPTNAVYMRIGMICGLNDYNSTIKIKVELGNKYTDWTPAPEDVSNEVNSVKEITESNSTTISVMQGQISTAINNTQIVKDGQTILLKDDYNRTVAKVDSINSTIGTHTTKINELTGSITSVDTKVNSVQRDLEGTKSTVSSHTSQISGLNSTVSTQRASISQLQNQIKLKVEATDIATAINNMQIGGRNLFLNSGFTKGLNYWQTYSCSNPQAVADSSALSGYVVKFTSTGGGIYQRKGGASNNPTNYPNGSVMTVSGYVKSSVANKVLRPNFENAGANTSKAVTCINANTWYYFTHTYTINSLGFSTVTFYGDSGADYYLKDVILEYGNKATTWTPAPEDIDSSIANVQTQVTTTINKVATIETNLDSITQRVSSTESTVSTHTSQLSTVDSRINTAKNSAISTAASDATTKANNAQSKALADAKSYTNGQITTVNKTITDKVAEIKTTTDSITQRVSSAETKVNTVTANFNNLQIGGRNLWIEKNLINAYESNGNATSSTSQHKMMSTYTDLNGAKYVTVQLWNPNSINNNSNSNRIAFYDSNKAWISSINTPKPNGTNYVSGIITVPTNAKYMKIGMITGSSQHESSIKIKVELGNKATDWTPSPEDIDSSIANVQTQVTTTSNKVATIETNLSSITSRVSSTESTVNTINGNITSLQNRMSSAEQQITSSAIINTVQSTINAAKSEAINSANSSTDNKLKSYATTSSLTQTENSITAKFESSGGSNLVKNGAFKNGTAYWTKWGSPSAYQVQNSLNGYGQELRIVTTDKDQGAYQTIEGLRTGVVHTVVVDVWVSSGNCIIYIVDGGTWRLSSVSSGTGWKKLHITFTPSNPSVTLRIGRGTEGTNGDYRFTGIRMYEGSAIQSWTPHHSEVYNGSTVIDANGVTINNGALTIKNKAGTTVLSGDSNGNLNLYAVGSKFKFTATGQRVTEMYSDASGNGDVFTIKVPFYNKDSGFRLCTDTGVNLIEAYAENGDVHRLKLHGFQTDNIKATYMVASKQLYRYDDSGIYWKPIYTRNENAGIKMIDKLGIVNKSAGGLYMQVDMDGGGAYGIDIWSSDVNLKKNIKELNSKIKPLSLQEDNATGLELIKKIKHYEFDYDETKGFEGHIDCGYVSQQLQEVNTNLVTEVEQEDGTVLLQPLASALLPHITKAMQQQQEKIEELENIILELKSRIGA
ncbi:phage tail spike protein [Clostridium saudiense]|uniref:phage tail spike protein n=2 Tax=Clostridium saudiense TaxID=1414720 RepID=UPI00311AB24A